MLLPLRWFSHSRFEEERLWDTSGLDKRRRYQIYTPRPVPPEAADAAASPSTSPLYIAHHLMVHHYI